MKNPDGWMNERIRDFFLGDDAAWEEVSVALRSQTAARLRRKFFNLPFYRLQDCVADWLTEFYFQVAEARARAEAEWRKSENPPADLNDLKLDLCAAETKFDLGRGTQFQAWTQRVLEHRVITLYRRFSKETGEFDENAGQPANFGNEVIENYDDEKTDDVKNYLPFLRETIARVLETEEAIYLEVWLAEGPDPTGKTVIAELERRTGKAMSSAYITKLKRRFLVKSYLALREASYQAEALSVLFRRFVQSDEMRKLFLPIMLENIWRGFVTDGAAVSVVKQELPQYRWRELFQSAETAIDRTEIRAGVLTIAYAHFRWHGHRPNFCRLIEIYADDRFGGGIRDLFKRG